MINISNIDPGQIVDPYPTPLQSLLPIMYGPDVLYNPIYNTVMLGNHNILVPKGVLDYVSHIDKNSVDIMVKQFSNLPYLHTYDKLINLSSYDKYSMTPLYKTLLARSYILGGQSSTLIRKLFNPLIHDIENNHILI